MPLVVERLESRQGSWGRDPDNTLRYQVTGEEDDAIAVAMVDAYSPLLYHGLVKQKIAIDPGEAPDIWYCDVAYGQMQKPEPGRVQWQFNMGGVTTHITQALAHVASYMPTGALPRIIPTKARSTSARTATGNWWSMAWTSAGPAGRLLGPRPIGFPTLRSRRPTCEPCT